MRQGLADALPYPDGSFDVAAAQFGLMFFEDRPAALRDMLRVLKPGGVLAVAVWDSLENSDGYRESAELLRRLAGDQAAGALEAPFVLGDRDALQVLLETAGAMQVSIDTQRGTARFPGVRTMVEADLRGWLPIMGVQLEEALIETILAQAEETLQQYVTPDGTMVFAAPAHLVTARRAPG